LNESHQSLIDNIRLNNEQDISLFDNGILLIVLQKNLVIDSYNLLDDFIDKIDSYEYFSEIKQVIFDLSNIVYMDSSGISLLIKYNKSLRNMNISFKIFGLSDSIKKIFSLTRIDSVLDIYSSLEEAINKNTSKNNNDEDVERFEIMVPADYSYIHFCTAFIMDIADSKFNIDESELVELRLSSEEIINNAIEHGYKDSFLKGNIQVWCMIIGSNLVVGVNDFGQGLDKEKVLEHIKNVPTSPFSDRGRGIFIVSQLMDDYIIDSNQNKNSIFYFVKKYKIRVKK